ncbi:MAG: HAMP domain-containing protein [Dethiosulfatibacter sp.]|nr:HAMP domain-containing protein [Dethiosulfatibacter sp.]
MKLGIRRQLIISFILAIILPVVITLVLLRVFTVKVNTNTEFEYLATPDLFFENTTRKIQDDFSNVTNHSTIKIALREYFESLDGSLIIMDIEGKVLFDSEDSNVYEKNIIQEFDTQYGSDLNIMIAKDDLVKYVKPIIINRQLVGNAIYEFNEQTMADARMSEIVIYLAISFLAGIAAFVLLMVLMTINISRNILIPINKLSVATERVAKGELDFVIDCSRKDEIGVFCEAFDSMKNQLKDSLLRQKEQDEAKKQLIASISHDLRTPMTSIKGYVEALKDGKAKDEITFKKYLTVIENKTAGLDRLIDDLVIFSKLETGKMDMHLASLNSQELLEGIASIKEQELSLTQCQLIIKRPFPSVRIEADKERMMQVVDNIFNNSIKYSSGNCLIMLESKVISKSLRIVMEDNGPGIHEDDLMHIFQQFYRGDKSRSREHGGTGLGLAICKYIIEEHGGKIWAESAIGKGTRITIELPIIESDIYNAINDVMSADGS